MGGSVSSTRITAWLIWLRTIFGTIAIESFTPANPDATPQRSVDTRIGSGGTTMSPGARVCFAVAGAPGDVAVVNLAGIGEGSGEWVVGVVGHRRSAGGVERQLRSGFGRSECGVRADRV